MTIVLDDYHRLKKEVDRDQREYDRLTGARAERLKTLRVKFKVKTKKEAKKALVKMEQAERDSFSAYNAARKEYEACRQK